MRSTDRPDRAAHRRLGLAALLACAAYLAACDDPFKVKAQFENVSQPFVVHAMSGTPLAFATALALPVKSVARVDGSLAFDVAFDLDAARNVVLLPVEVVAANPSGGRRVGVMRARGGYDGVLEAPTSGYTFDSVTVVARGETAVIQAQEGVCGLSVTPYLHAKLVVDSVDVPTRAIYGRTLINLNCGFRSLKTGLPEY